jgi:hypothetical protein
MPLHGEKESGTRRSSPLNSSTEFKFSNFENQVHCENSGYLNDPELTAPIFISYASGSISCPYPLIPGP